MKEALRKRLQIPCLFCVFRVIMKRIVRVNNRVAREREEERASEGGSDSQPCTAVETHAPQGKGKSREETCMQIGK